MLTFEECLAFSHYSEAEVLALAEKEHLPEMIALEYGESLYYSNHDLK